MPADPKLLLRAAVASSSAQGSGDGIKDRFASYHPKTRALRCVACDYLAIKHESLWASHAASKSHRSNVSRVKGEEEAKEAKLISAKQTQASMTDEDTIGTNKRKDHEDVSGARQPDEDTKRIKSSPKRFESGPIDAEWERFQREVLNASSSSNGQAPLSTYANATIEVAPSLKPGINGRETEEPGEDEEEEEVTTLDKTETEAEKRARLEREEREEIIARLEEEQRLQDEADERVNALKNRFERLKQARASKKKK